MDAETKYRVGEHLARAIVAGVPRRLNEALNEYIDRTGEMLEAIVQFFEDEEEGVVLTDG